MTDPEFKDHPDPKETGGTHIPGTQILKPRTGGEALQEFFGGKNPEEAEKIAEQPAYERKAEKENLERIINLSKGKLPENSEN